jgi:hypothetical protein
MSQAFAQELFRELLHTYESPKAWYDQYPALRTFLEKACVYQTTGLPLSFTDLSSRMRYLFTAFEIEQALIDSLHGLRVRANKWLHQQTVPDQSFYLSDLKSLASFIEILFEASMPEALAQIGQSAPKGPMVRPAGFYPRIRVQFLYRKEESIFVLDEEVPHAKPVQVRIHVAGINEAFTESVVRCQESQQLNLLDVTVDAQGVYTPTMLIVEPDFLVDISVLAACVKAYSRHPLQYLEGKLKIAEKTAPMLMGNIANSILDEWVNRADVDPNFLNTMRDAFKNDPFSLTANDKINKDFFAEAQQQFENIRDVVQHRLAEHAIQSELAVLEPAFICEALGIQGRLDFLTWDPEKKEAVIVELKSGKTPFPAEQVDLVDISHAVQAGLYKLVLSRVYPIPYSGATRAYILYSKAGNTKTALRRVTLPFSTLQSVLNLRNHIVLNEASIAFDAGNTVAKQLIEDIRPDLIIAETARNNRFVQQYIVPQLEQFRAPLLAATSPVLQYFFSFYQFVTLEQYLSKAGDVLGGSRVGAARSWLMPYADKCAQGDILADLEILERATTDAVPRLVLKRPPTETVSVLPNFRVGDIIVLYERNGLEDTLHHKQIFKGNIAALSPHSVTIELRFKQKNTAVFPLESRYALEHDHMDSGYTAMFRGLYALLKAKRDRQTLLLGERKPDFDLNKKLSRSFRQQGSIDCPELDDLLLKVKQAQDYFLLVGPPGTGKTSMALRTMVEELLTEPGATLLLLSYTNRAVDEICDALDNVQGQPNYARIGGSLTCAPKHRKRLLDQQLIGLEKREQVLQLIRSHRVFVGTVASLANKLELFQLLHFNAVIIDEASQILEPSLLSILCAQDKEGNHAIDKFIFIGDHKQLPAVVLQAPKQSAVSAPELRSIGITDRRQSLFERLHTRAHQQGWLEALGFLHRQGRMHPTIARFPNEAFYQNRLQPVPVAHQTESLPYRVLGTDASPLQKLCAEERLVFMASGSEQNGISKTHDAEAQRVAALLVHFYELFGLSGLEFNPQTTVGVITPYRSQIALIKNKIHATGIEVLQEITVDTVERFQGSQRDIILYSFTVNELNQLDFLSNLMIDEDQEIDRKLNVAITRARKQLFMLGNPAILENNLIYARLLAHIKVHGKFISLEESLKLG